MKAEYLPGNAITLLENGCDFFPALIAAIDAAQREFHLETYIFADDATGRAVADALCRAARRGVAVRVLADGFGAANLPQTLAPRLTAAGVRVLVYRPEIARFRLRRERLRRLHRKLAVADGRCAFVGGINIIDDTDSANPSQPRFDYAVCIMGPLLAPIHQTVRRLWKLVALIQLRRQFRLPTPLPVSAEACGSMRAAFVIRDNLRHRHDIEEAYLEVIGRAQGEILIANAYFLPGGRFRQALLDAAARGVQVTVLLQGRVEYALQHYATQSLYDTLLRAGIRIFEYHRSYLHAKVAVIDCCWATVGSSNIDPFSLLLAREANVFVDDREFAMKLRGSLEAAMQEGARELRCEDWLRKAWIERLASRLAYWLVRLLIGIAGQGGRH